MRVCVCLCVNGWPENAWLTKGEERDFFSWIYTLANENTV